MNKSIFDEIEKLLPPGRRLDLPNGDYLMVYEVVPNTFYSELAAVAELVAAERCGLYPVGSQAPIGEQLLQELVCRLQNDLASFYGAPEDSPLIKRVRRILGDITYSNAEVTSDIIAGGNLEALLDVFAELLWQHRHLGK